MIRVDWLASDRSLSGVGADIKPQAKTTAMNKNNKPKIPCINRLFMTVMLHRNALKSSGSGLRFYTALVRGDNNIVIVLSRKQPNALGSPAMLSLS